MYINLLSKWGKPVCCQIRLLSSKHHVSSASIRKSFIEYFTVDNNHTFVKSSPLRPLTDKTIPFTNAGMNQFKSILEGTTPAPWTQVSNTQKCARVGGKHNDLTVVGKDGYHHTFFEMLGNWSFGNYFKKGACEMAWQLLTEEYRLDPNRLYVTYFAGDESLGLEPDMECVDVWRSLGVEKNRILPFGIEHNFWEMGLTGPCGGCTEIHVDHIVGRSDARSRVNAGFPDVTELWNLVFVQFNRGADGSLNLLPKFHVDTGMGFERLVALLNGCASNYDTDLFQPLHQTIEKFCAVPSYSGTFAEADQTTLARDEAYRILSDHARFITVALADGIFPDSEHKLRWAMRKAFKVAKDVMKADERLIIELINYVADTLGDTYPEIRRNLNKVHYLIEFEAETFTSLQKTYNKDWIKFLSFEPQLENLVLMGSHPTAVTAAYKNIKSLKENGERNLTGEIAYRLYDSNGISVNIIESLSEIVGMSFNPRDFHDVFEKMKIESKVQTMLTRSIGSDVTVNKSHSSESMKNQSATHLLSNGLNRQLDVVNPGKCVVDPNFLKYSFNFYTNLEFEDIVAVEHYVKHIISEGLSITSKEVSIWELLKLSRVILPPGAILSPERIPIIEIIQNNDVLLREPSNGTCVSNTADIGSFCITQFLKDKNKCTLCALTGIAADNAIKNGEKLMSLVETIGNELNTFMESGKGYNGINEMLLIFERVEALKQLVKNKSRDLPFAVHFTAKSFIDKVGNDLDRKAWNVALEEVKAVSANKDYLVYMLRSTSYLKTVPLQKLTRHLPPIPIILIAPYELSSKVKARCCIPQDLTSSDFDAKTWLKIVEEAMGSKRKYDPSKADDLEVHSAFVSNVPAVEFNQTVYKSLKTAMKKAASKIAEQIECNKFSTRYLKR